MKSLVKRIKETHPVVRKPRPIRYRFIFSRMYSSYLFVFHLLPRYLYHYLKRPYCRAMPTLDYQISLQSIKQPGAEPSHPNVPMKVERRLGIKRNLIHQLISALSKLPQRVHAIGLHSRDPRVIGLDSRGPRALLDAMLSFALDACTEQTGAKIAPETGQFVLLLFQFIRYLDDYLDKHREAGIIPTLYEILAVPEIVEQMIAVYCYLEPFSCSVSVLKYLWQLLDTYYDSYHAALHLAGNSFRFEDVLEVAKIDSGLAGRTVMEIACLFNGCQLAGNSLTDFYYFAMIVKFADDMSDLIGDVAKELPNLFYALTRQNPEEFARLQFAIEQEGNASLAWCRKYCPLTYMQYLEYIEHYYQQMQSPGVRKLALLVFAAYYHSFGMTALIEGDLSS